MLLPILLQRAKVIVFPTVLHSVRNIFSSMAASNDASNKENMADHDGEAEQIVTMEKVVAADNKGIDYNKLISE